MTDDSDPIDEASTGRGELPASDPGGDELPEDLDVNVALVGPYTFPDNQRRRIAGSIYGVLALACAAAGWGWQNGGLQAVAVVLLVIAAYQWLCAWPLAVDQTDALGRASNAVGFPIGHASAQVAWRGLRSRPTWRILCYSADEPPSIRGLVELDAVDGRVLGEYTEANPEDWSVFGLDNESDVTSASSDPESSTSDNPEPDDPTNES